MTTRVDFEQIEQSLQRVAAPSGAAESHGILCGLICANGCGSPEFGVSQVLDGCDQTNLLVQECAQLVRQAFAEICERFNDSELGFYPLLPADHYALGERAEALAQWCDGFMVGLGFGGVKAGQDLPAETGEFLHDLAEISQVEFAVDQAAEEEEAAYVEILEYVRMGVLVAFEQLQPTLAAPEQLQ